MNELDHHGFELPDPPDNLDFLELFTDEQQAQIDARFQRGIAKNYAALDRARADAHALYLSRQAERVRREQAKERQLARRFNPVLRSRP